MSILGFDVTRIFNSEIDFDKLKEVLMYDASNPLFFNTGLFLMLFIGFICLYQALRRFQNFRFIVVILFSLYFYYKSSAEYCFILLGLCVTDFGLGNLMSHAKKIWIRKAIVLLNVTLNIGMLLYFKYLNLLVETFANISGTNFDPMDIILPAGLSFFTFRSISYIVDIYRGKIGSETNFLHYTFYLTFFPPLLAGPVVRASDILPQIKANPTASRAMVGEGLFLIMSGLVKKVIIADYLSGNFIDRIFDNPLLYSGFENLVGIYSFTLQLYCDFSGYSDMAIGIALLMGYRFQQNFDSPFKSQNPTEYWRRWHISLSLWLRDYLYIPMGGNRSGKWRSQFNVFNTMLIGGLWHGASWMYIIWGAWNGMLLVLHKILKNLFPSLATSKQGSWWRQAGNVFITFNLIAVGMLFFRARTLEQTGHIVTQIFTKFHANVIPEFIESYLFIVIAIVVGYAMHFSPHSWVVKTQERFSLLPQLLQALIVSIVIYIIIQVRSGELVPFIYLQY